MVKSINVFSYWPKHANPIFRKRLSSDHLWCVLPSFQTHEVKTSAGAYIPQIMSILNRVPRPLLLIFKTNDLLRGIESSLQSKGVERSQLYVEKAALTMFRCCVHAVCDHRSAHCSGSRLCRWRCTVEKNWLLMLLTVYESYLRLSDWFHALTRTIRRRVRDESLRVDLVS